MSVYGYCRISTAKQSIDRQIRNIKAEYPTAHIVQEAYTGTSIFRPEWLKLYRILKSGDMVVFDSVSRMSRNAEEGFAMYEELFNRQVCLIFLKEPHINTDTYRKALQGHPAGVFERAPHRHRNLQKSHVRQHCHDRDKCGLHLEGHQRVSDGLGKGADQTGL